MKLYIDADSLLYRSAHLNAKGDDALREAERLDADEEAEELGLETTKEAHDCIALVSTFHSMVREIEIAVKEEYPEIEETILVITVKPKLDCCAGMADNFRYSIMDSVDDPKVLGYKANRAGMEVPEGLNDIYEYVFRLDNTECHSGIEADDAVVYYGRQGHIVAALDKDVIGSLEIAYNYGKKEWIINNPLDIKLFPYKQTIMGDTSDGLRGVYRIGAKGADKLLAGLVNEFDLWRAVVTAYYSKEQTLDEAIATMRCVRMDQWTPETGLVLWEPPKRRTDESN